MQSARLAPSQTASMIRNLTSGGPSHAIINTQNAVSRMLSALENRFCRSQPIAPELTIGGGSGSNGFVRTKASLVSVMVAMSLIIVP